MKPVFTNVISDENYFTLVDGNKMINNSKNTKVFNIFFSNVIKNLKIPEYSKIGQLSKRTKDPVLKAIIKCKQHLSINAIKQKSNCKNRFSFFCRKSKIKKKLTCFKSIKLPNTRIF